MHTSARAAYGRDDGGGDWREVWTSKFEGKPNARGCQSGDLGGYLGDGGDGGAIAGGSGALAWA